MMRGFWMMLTLLAVLATPALAVQFDHKGHLAYVDNDCASCHVPEAQEIRPETATCLNCHDEDMMKEVTFTGTATHGVTWALSHRPAAKANTPDCSACHAQEDCLECHKAGFADEQGHFGNSLTNVHRSEFQVTHPLAARTDPQLCTSCHEVRFCSDCHDAFGAGRAGTPSHRRTFDLGEGIPGNPNIDAIHANAGANAGNCDTCHPNGTVAPDFAHWSADHAREARRNLMTCQSCHPGGDTCVRCHSAVGGTGQFNPHGKGWGKRADRLNDASNGKTCRRCHDGF